MTTVGRRETIAGLVGASLIATPLNAQTATPKRGGTLRMSVNTVPASASIHEEMSYATAQPFMPVFNNLVMFDQHKRINAPDSIVPDLGVDWSWSEGNTKLTFKLARNVVWHDGKPFRPSDVKYTWDTLRRLTNNGWRRTPRRQHFFNLDEVSVLGDDAVSFKLRRPQPSFMTLLATGFTPVYPEHVDGAAMRRNPVGTGPFRVTAFDSNRIALVRNEHYWKSGRPYLDGIDWTIIQNAGTLGLAFVAGKLDVVDVPIPQMADLKAQVPTASYSIDLSNSHYHIFLNTTRPPFDDPRVRQALNLAIDRHEFLTVIAGGQGAIGGQMLPAPFGVWGLPPEEIATVPGFGPNPEADREAARKLMREAGYGPDRPLRFPLITRNVGIFRSVSVLLMDQMRKIGIESEMKLVETAQWDIVQAQGDWPIVVTSYGGAADDPDVVLYDGFACDSNGNFSHYCTTEMQARIEAQSAELDPMKRARMVRDIDRTLMEENVRPVLIHNAHCVCQHAHVKDFVSSGNGLYNNWRMEDVWLDT